MATLRRCVDKKNLSEWHPKRKKGKGEAKCEFVLTCLIVFPPTRGSTKLSRMEASQAFNVMRGNGAEVEIVKGSEASSCGGDSRTTIEGRE